MKQTTILVILDGWGIGEDNDTNPIYKAGCKTLAALVKRYPVTSLEASGIAIGLPWGEAGNSEVGHLTIGAGMVLYQHFPRISMAIQDNSFFENPVLRQVFAHAKKNSSTVNLVGLLTKGNAHASLDHLHALLVMAKMEGVTRIKLHLFADGKDSTPGSIIPLLDDVPRELIATLTGRYYAMDRNGRWQLTQAAYNAMTQNGSVQNPVEAVNASLAGHKTEEYLPPTRLQKSSAIEDGDALFFFNFREDSMRQLAESFINPLFDKFPVKKFENLHIATMTRYEEKLEAPVAFPAPSVLSPLGAVLESQGKTQLHIAETLKYAHVTYFFNGYREAPFKNEFRVLIPSLSSPRPEEHPEMMADAVSNRLVSAIENRAFDFILANYANSDTMAHTGNFEAGVKAAQVLDAELLRIAAAAEASGATLIITSDHGNLERMLDPLTGRAETQHDANPVPFYLIDSRFEGRTFDNWRQMREVAAGTLADIAPTILDIMGLQKPPEMTGRSLLNQIV